jgi:HSP20 family protein
MPETQSAVPVKRSTPAARLRDPFDLFDDFPREMARIWGQMLPFFPRPIFRPFGGIEAPGTWAPRVDAYDKNGSLIVKAELPGVSKDDVQVSLEGDDLVIQGERKAESEVKEEDYYRLERAHGSFHRRMSLPFSVEAGEVSAVFNNGILEIHIPRPKEAKPSTQKIKIS